MRHFNNVAECAEQFAIDMASFLGRQIEKNGSASLAVSGGRTPEHIFPLLSQANVAWEKVTITLEDERWVNADHPDSNEGLTRRFLMQNSAAQARFIGLKSDHADPIQGQETVENALSNIDWPLDAIYLGMGEDGHIASLFPNGGWENVETRCIGIPAAESRQARMSLSPSALLNARRIYLVITGSEKRAVLEEALKPGPASDLPVRLILHQNQVPLEIYAVV